jgi:predicted permease
MKKHPLDGLDDDIRDHIERETQEHVARGMAPEEARRQALLTFGNRTLVTEDTRAVWGWIVVEQVAQDLRYAARTLSRTPHVTLPALLTLALGIGLTTAIFSVIYGILFRPLPFLEPDRLVALHTIRQQGDTFDNALSPPNFMSLKEDDSRVFSALAGALSANRTLMGADEARTIEGARVSDGFFEVLGVRPLLGRSFTRNENQPGQELVIILSHALWQSQFGGDSGVIGRRVVLDGVPHTVVGVMPGGFDFHGRAFFVPQPYGRNYFSATSTDGRRGDAVVRVVGRLRPGVSLEAAEAELTARSRQLEQRFPETNAGVRFRPTSFHDDIVGDVRTPLLLLFGAVGLVLLIATANVAGLLLARAAGRREEIAVRGALGAARNRIVRQLVTEALLLGVAGGALGLILAFWATDQLVAAQLDSLQRLGLADSIRVDGVVLAFAVGVTFVAGALAGVLPAFRAADDGLRATLQSAGRGGDRSRSGRKLRSGLVVTQLALTAALLYGAGLLLHSFLRLTSIDPGFRTEHVLSFQVTLPPASYDTNARVQTLFSDLLGRIGQHVGVRSVGAIHHLPIGSAGRFMSRFQVEGRVVEGEDSSIPVRIVTPGYFETIGVPILRGRALDDGDRVGRLPTVLINATASARLFPGEDPIGRRLVGFGYDPLQAAASGYTVVGIVADVRSRGLREPPQAEAYFAHAQVPLRQMFVVVRTNADPFAQIGAIRSELRDLDRNLPVPSFRTLDQVVADSLDRPRYFATLVTLFSAIALTLATVGIFGISALTVAQRTREIGVRIALGASPRSMVTMIVREALMLVAMGLGIGVGGALAFARMLQSELFELRPTDPATFAGVIMTLASTALLASLVAAWRASTVDPLVALRAE